MHLCCTVTVPSYLKLYRNVQSWISIFHRFSQDAIYLQMKGESVTCTQGPTTSISGETMNQSTEKIEICTLHVCTSCRPPSVPRDPKTQRPGYLLYQKLQEALPLSPLQDKVELKAAGCLSICPRPCGIAISKPGAWTYLFGDQVPTKTVEDILECVATYLESSKGFMPRANRPRYLRRSILGRVPPIQLDNPCI